MPLIYSENIEDLENYEPGVEPSEMDANYSSYVMNKVKLSQRLDEMKPEEKRLLVKTMQFKILKEILDTVKNLKSTTADTWKKVMGKLEAIIGIDIGEDKSGFDFNAMARALLPLIGTLAGTMLAFRAAHKAEIDAATPITDPDNPLSEIKDPDFSKKELEREYDSFVRKSIVLQMCNKKEKGFSLNGSTNTGADNQRIPSTTETVQDINMSSR